MNNTQFEKGLQNLRKVSIEPEKKGKMFGALLRYAKTHPAKAEATETRMQKFKKLALIRLFIK